MKLATVVWILFCRHCNCGGKIFFQFQRYRLCRWGLFFCWHWWI